MHKTSRIRGNYRSLGPGHGRFAFSGFLSHALLTAAMGSPPPQPMFTPPPRHRLVSEAKNTFINGASTVNSPPHGSCRFALWRGTSRPRSRALATVSWLTSLSSLIPSRFVVWSTSPTPRIYLRLQQSLEIYDRKGHPLHAHKPEDDHGKKTWLNVPAEKRRVIEYLVLEKRMWYDGPWTFRDQLWEKAGKARVAA